MSVNLTPFGAYLRKWKIDNSMTNKAFAKSVSVSTSIVTLIEFGDREIKMHEVFNILKFLNLDADKTEAFIDLATSTNKTLVMDISTLNTEKRVLSYNFARQLSELSIDNVINISNILKRR